MDDEAIGAYVDTVSAAIGLVIQPAHRPGVIDNIRMITAQSASLVALHLDDAEEIGPIFRP